MDKINLKSIEPSQIEGNFIDLIGKQWMLVTAGTPESFNTMTASWGSAGTLWNLPVALCFVRPQRYTFRFMEEYDNFTLSFLGSGYRRELALLGSLSGRDTDKVARAGLTPVATSSGVAFAQARLVLDCRKIYGDFLSKEAFVDSTIPGKIYPDDDFHKMFIGKITGAWMK
ncbi:MAG: flavin reductase family protein [Rikenellaceae bacterium]|nr:flavin reductase family protein [Rikenellaceae bacterium]